jgi:Holliday junction DNA helicase RuvB
MIEENNNTELKNIDSQKPISDPVEETAFLSMRPKDFSDYIGQARLKDQLQIMINSSLMRKAALDHLLFFGLPGMGKTSLAQIIASLMSTNLIVTSGQALEKTGDVAAILASLNDGDILFIDEIHRLKPKVEEMLYTAMEDFAIDIVLGKGPTAKVMRLNLPNFTLVGATTRLHKIANPLKDRFGMVLQLEEYENEDIAEILKLNATKLDMKVEDEALYKIAECSRSTPRIAIHFLKRARDLLLDSGSMILNKDMAEKLLNKIGLKQNGLNIQDILLLKKLHLDFNNGPVGLSTLAASVNDDPANIEDTVEPFLIRLGLLKRTHRGRQLTDKGVKLAKNMV